MPVAKPQQPRIYQPAGAPIFWALMHAPSKTFGSDTGDVADLMRGTAAGTRTAGCAWTNGPYGRCLSFDGVGYCTMADSTALALGASLFEICCRVKTTTSGSRRTIMHKFAYVGGGGSEPGVYIDILSTGIIRCALQSDNSNSMYGDSAVTVNDGNWHDIAYRRTSATSQQIVIDGIDRTTSTALAGSPFGITCSQPLGIGQPWPNFTNSPFVGQIDNVRIRNFNSKLQDINKEAADPFWRLRPTARPMLGTLPATPRLMYNFRRRRTG